MRSTSRLAMLTIVLMLVHAPELIQAQDKPQLPAESTWQGTLDVGAASLRVQVRLRRGDDGRFSGTLVSVDQGNAAIEMDTVEVKGNSLSFECAKIAASFSGTFDEKFTKLSGTFTQGVDLPLELTPLDAAKNPKHVQTWSGTMKAGSREFDMQVRLFRDEQSQWSGRLDSFSEKLADLNLEITKYDEQTLSFNLPITKAIFEGNVDAAQGKIVGKWKQSGQQFDLTLAFVDLSKTRSMEPLKRPQTPTKPLPYRSLDVQFENATDKVTLSGTLTLPQESGKFATAILISGSGAQDRDETLLDHKPFLVLSDYLTRAGFAVLRFDDRGIGKSTGDLTKADSRDFARDVGAAIDFLKQHPEIEPTKIGLIGHSEGGLIAPIVATTRNDVAFIVMLAGPGVPGRDIILSQTELIERAEGVPAEISKFNRDLTMAMFDMMNKGMTDEELKTNLRKRFEELRDKLPEEKRVEMPIAEFERNIQISLTPWFRYFLTYDPRPALEKVRCPVLALNGELDLQVDPKLNLPEIERALQKGGNKDHQVVMVAKSNHLFQTAQTGSPSEYRVIEETMSPTVLKSISDWLAQRFR